MMPIGLTSHRNDVIRPIRPGPLKQSIDINGLRVIGADTALRLSQRT